MKILGWRWRVAPLVFLAFALVSACGNHDHSKRLASESWPEDPVECPGDQTVIDNGIAKRQPYECRGRWLWNAPIPEAGYCGPASLYHIIDYYDDQGVYEYRVGPVSSESWSDTPIEISEITPENPTAVGETAFGQFIQSEDQYGSNWAMLDDVANLYRSRDLDDKLYDVFVCPLETDSDEIEVRRRRLQDMCERVLEKNIPVVIHLSSYLPGLGHYVTLIGYDALRSRVYYVDSLHHDEGILMVSVDDFLSAAFYTSGMFYSARWDGSWMAFWHHGADIVCPPCTEDDGLE